MMEIIEEAGAKLPPWDRSRVAGLRVGVAVGDCRIGDWGADGAGGEFGNRCGRGVTQSVYAATSPRGISLGMRCEMIANPPLYYLLLKGWMACFGEGLGFDTGDVGVVWSADDGGGRGPLAAMRGGLADDGVGDAIDGGAPPQIYYAQEKPRGYTSGPVVADAGLVDVCVGASLSRAGGDGRGCWHGVVVGLGIL